MSDQDLMPFGKYKGEKMENVPASYLLWLRDQGCSDMLVRGYIDENLTVLVSECPDYIEERKTMNEEESIEQKIIKSGGVILSEPLTTEEGFLNPACMNQLEAALGATSKTWERLREDQEWSIPQWLFLKHITGAFAMWAVRQSPYELPDGLGNVVAYLSACLRRSIPWNEDGMAKLSLCEINHHLYQILYEQGVAEFDAWNERKNKREGTGFCSAFDKPSPDDDFIDLDALLHNVCLTIRDDRRRDAEFDRKFEEEENSNTNPTMNIYPNPPSPGYGMASKPL